MKKGQFFVHPSINRRRYGTLSFKFVIQAFDSLLAPGKTMNGFSLVPSPFAAKHTETLVFSWPVVQSSRAFANVDDRGIRYHILPYCCLVHRNDIFVGESSKYSLQVCLSASPAPSVIQWFCAWLPSHVLTWTAETNWNWQQTVAFLSPCISLHREILLCLRPFFSKYKGHWNGAHAPTAIMILLWCVHRMAFVRLPRDAFSCCWQLLVCFSFAAILLILLQSTPNFAAAFWLLLQSSANRTALSLNLLE